MQAKGSADGNDQDDGVADAHGRKGDIAELVALQHLATDILVFRDLVAQECLAGISGGRSVAGEQRQRGLPEGLAEVVGYS